MFDTIRVAQPNFNMPVGVDDEKWESCGRTIRGAYFERYRLQTEKLDPSLRHVRCIYDHTQHELVVEVSLPRLAYGHNIVTVRTSELAVVLELLDQIVQGWGLLDFHGQRLCDVPSVSSWHVRRLDLVLDYRPRQIPHAAALQGLLNLQPPGRLTAVRINNQTAYFKTKGKRKRVEIAIYDKQHEAQKTCPQHSQLATNAIRLEVRLFGQDTIKKAFGLANGPTLADVSTPVAVAGVIKRRLADLDVRPGLESTLTGFDALKDRIGAKAARRLWSYVQARSNCSRREIVAHWGISADTARRYERELRSAGLFPAAVATKGIIEDLLSQLATFANEHAFNQRPQTSDASQLPELGSEQCA